VLQVACFVFPRPCYSQQTAYSNCGNRIIHLVMLPFLRYDIKIGLLRGVGGWPASALTGT
jgi:hypothetical protein